MATATKAYAAQTNQSPVTPWNFERREPNNHDVQFDILYCGVCHSDLHQIRDEWFPGIFPMVPGHEIVGRVTNVGSHVKKHKVGDLVGVGCMVDSCRTCENCEDGLEQYCVNGSSQTYNGMEQDICIVCMILGVCVFFLILPPVQYIGRRSGEADFNHQEPCY